MIKNSLKENKIIFKLEKHKTDGFLNSSLIAAKLLELLPIESRIWTWGDELYFPIDLDMELINPVGIVRIGDIAYSKTPCPIKGLHSTGDGKRAIEFLRKG